MFKSKVFFSSDTRTQLMGNAVMEVNVEAAQQTKVAGLWFDKTSFWQKKNKKIKPQAAAEQTLSCTVQALLEGTKTQNSNR